MLTRLIRVVNRRYSTSALFISGDKAHETFALLTPHVDVDERLADKDALVLNLKSRGFSMDLEKFETRWAFYLHLLDRKHILGQAKSEIGKEITKLVKDGEEKNREEIEKYKGHLRVVKDEYWVLKNYMHGVEESAVLSALALPNNLHQKTPLEKESVVVVNGDKVDHVSKSHLEIGSERNLIETYSTGVFLKNEAALFEQAVLNYFHENLLSANFIMFSNADFCKSLVIEGCGGDFANENQVLTLNTGDHTINRLHLTGGASHYSFLAYLTKNSMTPSHLPLKLFTSGRKYTPNTSTQFNSMQQSSIEICILTKDNAEMDENFENASKKIAEIYAPLGHFRGVYLPANQLSSHESLRFSLQMFSNHLQDYLEVGCVSVCDDYLSKRLLVTYNEKKERRFAKIVIGNVLNVQKLLACKLENGGELMSDVLKQHL